MSKHKTWTAAEVGRAMKAARQRIEAERRAQFAPFGISPDCLWPASRLFHEHSSLGPAWSAILTADEVATFTRSLDYKQYPGAERVALPHRAPLSADLESTIRARRSVRDFSAQRVSLTELAKVLELSSGVMEIDDIPRRAAPSGGGLYPVEMYALAFEVEGLRPGVWHYMALNHVLEDIRPLAGVEVMEPFLPPGLLAGHPKAILALSVVFARTQMKYLERGYRFAVLEAGHIAQNVVLVSTALGLGTVCVGGFWDEPFNDLLGLEPTKEAVVYSVLLGHPH